MRASVRCFMVPDFNELRKQSSHSQKPESLEPSSDGSSGNLTGSQQFETSCDGEASRGHRTPKKPKRRRSAKAFKSVPEVNNRFLPLWVHRYDFIFSPHPDPGKKPDWKTESRYQLSDRLIEQGAFLYGVRPGATTSYALLDIDIGSPYHPHKDPLALQRMCEALEPLGLVESLVLTSSGSNGLHIYLPTGEELPSWKLALAVAALLENAGFKIMSGWLEIFPNRKSFATDGSISLYNGHRLPLQQGSYLLNKDLNPIASSHDAFVRQWQQAADRNDICLAVLEQIIKQALRKTYRVTGKAEKFLNDLCAEIEPGWSGSGQTNYLLGRITMRSFIFGHVLYAATPLSGQALADDVARVARALPGFHDYCGHQRDLEARAKELAVAIEKSHYFPYASGKPLVPKDGPTWNEQQQAKARDRIQGAVLDLFRKDSWPDSGVAARFDLLCAAGLSGSTLYKHQDLWHPKFFSVDVAVPIPVKSPPKPPALKEGGVIGCAGGELITPSPTSLLGEKGCKQPEDKASSSPEQGMGASINDAGCNDLSIAELSVQEGDTGGAEQQRTPPPHAVISAVQLALRAAKAAQLLQQQAYRKQQASEMGEPSQSAVAHLEKLHQWVESGDPILMAEALKQLSKINDG